MNKAMFSDAKVGDKVWSEGKGWGKIIEEDKGDRLAFKVEFKLLKVDWDTAWFTEEGVEEDDINPTLFWDEVKIVPPERPKELHICELEYAQNLTHYWKQCKCGKTEDWEELPKETCEACERLKIDKPFIGESLKFLLNQHHTCEKKDA